MACVLLRAPTPGLADDRVIVWSISSTNFSTLFAANAATNIVSVAPEELRFATLGDDGAVTETSRSGTVGIRADVTNIVAIASSTWYLDSVYMLALGSAGTVNSWGYGPAVPPNLTNLIAVAAGMSDSIALRSDGTVLGWGYNSSGELNIPRGLSNVVAISAGAHHNLALKSDGTVVAWGGGLQNTVPHGLSNVVGIAAGYNHSLALKTDGRVVAWGYNAGDYSEILAGISNVAFVAAGWGDVALRTDGTIAEWGSYDGAGPIVMPAPAIATNVVSLVCGYQNMAILGSGLPRTPARPMRITVPWGLPLVLPSVPAAVRALACQWRLNGTELAGGTNQTLFLANVDFADAGVYTAVVSNWYGTVTSSYSINVVPFHILASPRSQSVFGGATVTFSVSALGAGLSYQWGHDGCKLEAATNSTLVLTNVSPEQAGVYEVVVRNLAGAQTNTAVLAVTGTLRLIAQPLEQTALAGGSSSFFVGAEGVAPMVYQWRFNGLDLPGETNSSLTLADLTLDRSGVYSVLVSNNYAAIQSSNAALAVLALGIVGVPQDVVTFKGATASFAVIAKGIMPATYQWRFNGANLVGETGASLVLTNAQFDQSGSYSVTVQNAFTNLTASAVLAVDQVANWNYPYGQMASPPGLTNLIGVATGGFHNIALRRDRTVVVWGADTGEGELSVPSDATNVIAVAAGGNKNLVLRGDGTVFAWGSNANGENAVPEEATNVVAIASGDTQSLALRADGTVVGWGSVVVPTDATNIVAIAAGYVHALALRADGTVIGWGGNNYGQAAIPETLKHVVAIAAGGYDSLALASDGSIVNWGQGTGTLDSAPDGMATEAIGVGFGIGYALKVDGRLAGLGVGGGIPAGLTNVISVSVGYSQVLALIGDGPPVVQSILTDINLGANGFSVSLPTSSGRVYCLEYADSLAGTKWTALPLVAGTGETRALVDRAGASFSHRYYRVRRW